MFFFWYLLVGGGIHCRRRRFVFETQSIGRRPCEGHGGVATPARRRRRRRRPLLFSDAKLRRRGKGKTKKKLGKKNEKRSESVDIH